MAVDLKLIGERYSIIVLVFFPIYVFLQPPATVVLRKLGPRTFLPTITILWGIAMICFGFVKQWYEMIPLRLVLGVFEAGFFPGCAYLLSCWYPRYELQKRNAVFYLIGSMSSAFSGILAYGFWQMNGLGDLGSDYGQHYGPTKLKPHAPSGIMPGIAGWRWIFIMQGLITVVVGTIGVFTIVDFPELAAKRSKTSMSFLSEREAAFVVARIEKDRHDVIAEPFQLGQYLKNALDLKVLGFACLFGLTTTVTYAIAYFLPIILNAGKSPIEQPYLPDQHQTNHLDRHGLLRRRLPMPHRPTLRRSRNRHVRLRRHRRQIPHPRPARHDQRGLRHRRTRHARLRRQPRRALRRRLPRYHLLQRKRALRAHLAGEQYPWPVEESAG